MSFSHLLFEHQVRNMSQQKEFMDCFEPIDTDTINISMITAETKERLLHEYFQEKTIRMYSKKTIADSKFHREQPIPLVNKICAQKKRDALEAFKLRTRAMRDEINWLS